MTGVLLHFEPYSMDVFSGKDISLDAWNYAFKAAGSIDQVVIVDIDGEAKPFGDFPTTIISDISQFSPVDPTKCYVIDVPWTNCPCTPLWNFDHQNVDWYMFGPANGWQDAFPSYPRLTIPQSGTGALHSMHIASIVMAHRYGMLG